MKKHLDHIVCVTLAAAILISLFAFSYPAVSAAGSDEAAVGYEYEDELADTGYNHRGPSFDSVPDMIDNDMQKGMSELFLSAASRSLDIFESFQLNVIDAYSSTVNSRVIYATSDNSVAEVSDSGVVTAVRSGSAEISVYDRVTGKEMSCNVTVSGNIAPTETPKPAPTDEPTDPPEPTQKPTQAPTAAPKPTIKPTQIPTQKPTQAPTTAPKPTQKPTQAPTSAPKPTTAPETLSLKASSATVWKGCYYHVIASSNTTVSYKSSNTSVATVNSSGIVACKAVGKAVITAYTSTKSATCTITVKAGSSVNLSNTSATVDRDMTYMLRSTTSGVKWFSTDPSVATVTVKGEYALVYAAKPGYAVITAYTSSGAATCQVKVDYVYPVRFSYTYPNCAAKNQQIKLICVTDTGRTAVRYAVNTGSSVKYVDATVCTKEGNTLVWTGYTSFPAAGTYKVQAYSKYNQQSGWSTCDDGATTAFVANSTDMTTTVCANRRASNQLINLIATFEGYSSTVYIDEFTGDPTHGYGVLVYPGEKFYNNLTKTEAYAYLVQNVNNAGYTSSVNSFLVSNKIKFNQRQFDALVCFAYNCGTGPLYSDDELIDALLNCSKNGVRDFNYIGKQYFINKLCQYHHAGGGCVYGLLYRRVDETEMFFYGDYTADYGSYRYPISFTCTRNSSFHT